MQYQYSDDQVMFQDSLKKWVRDHYDYERRRGMVEADNGFDPQYWRQLAELGVLGLPFAEEFGGIDGDFPYLMAVSECIGQGLVLEPFLSSVVLAGQLLARSDNREQRERWLPPLISGDSVLALAWEERSSRGNPLFVELRAQREGDGYTLRGEKLSVIAAEQAQAFLVSARSSGAVADDAGLSLFVVDANTPGVTVQSYRAVDGQRAATLQFNDVRIPADAALCAPGSAGPLLQSVIDEAIVVLGAEAIGVMDQLLAATVEYCRNRKQFGLPIAAFQALQHRMADMYIACEQTRSLLWAAAQALGTSALPRAASMLKAQVATGGRFVGQQAIQLHGGMGMTDELSVGAYFKRLTAMDCQFGNRDYHLGRLADNQFSAAMSAADAA